MLLDVSNLAVTYGGGAATVSHVNLELDKGEILSIVGESGSGKTTVVRAILGVLPGNGRVTEGAVFFSNRNILESTNQEWRNIRGKEIAMIFQDSGSMINPVRRIGCQFIDYIKRHSSCSEAEAYNKGLNMLELMKLADAKNIMRSYPFELSGGMRQRVGIAMAMTFKPKLLLADEPTSALDVTIQAQIVRQIVDLRNELGVAVIIVTHNLGVAAYMSNKIVVMRNGKVVEAGTGEQVILNPESDYTKELLEAVPEIGGKRFV
jgi:ABC-type dipeptide/oligopeptide/nickel transport system ATPase component